MTEKEYHEWFNKYLSDVESLSSAKAEESLFVNAPKPTRDTFWKWTIGLSMIAFAVLSALFYWLDKAYDLWVLGWLSGITANFSIGLVASLFLLLYTGNRERNILFYTDALPILEKRIENMHKAYFDYVNHIRPYWQNGEYQECYSAWHCTSNCCFVILNYLLYLEKVLPFRPQSFDFTTEEIEDEKNKISEADNTLQKEFFSKDIISENTVVSCENAATSGFAGLMRLEDLKTELRQNMYRTKYHRKNYHDKSMDDLASEK